MCVFIHRCVLFLYQIDSLCAVAAQAEPVFRYKQVDSTVWNGAEYLFHVVQMGLGHVHALQPRYTGHMADEVIAASAEVDDSASESSLS